MNNIIQVPANFTPRDYQLKLFQAMDGVEGKPETMMKRAILVWHRRAGKDRGCFAYIVSRAVRQKGIYYYFFPEYSQAEKALWENIGSDGNDYLSTIPDQLIEKKLQNKLLIKLTNGSIIRLVGTDDIEKLRGVNPIGCVFSEYQDQDPQIWTSIVAPILMENKGWVIFNGTPKGQNHFYRMYEAAKDNDKWFCSLKQTLWADRPGFTNIVNPDDIEDEKLMGADESEIEQEYGCSFLAGIRGSYYGDCMSNAHKEKRISSYIYDSSGWVDTFWDLGYNDSTVCWFRQVDGNKIIFIDYHEDSGKKIDIYVQMLKDKGYRYRTHYLPHDGVHHSVQTGMTTSDIFTECCVSAGISNDVVTLKRGRILDDINAVRRRFSRYHFDEGKCQEGILALEAYHKKYNKMTKTFHDSPAHDWSSHCADAIRTEALAGETYEDSLPVNNIKVVTKFNPFS